MKISKLHYPFNMTVRQTLYMIKFEAENEIYTLIYFDLARCDSGIKNLGAKKNSAITNYFQRKIFNFLVHLTIYFDIERP